MSDKFRDISLVDACQKSVDINIKVDKARILDRGDGYGHFEKKWIFTYAYNTMQAAQTAATGMSSR